MQMDWFILDWIHHTLSSGAMDFFMTRITLLGDAGAIWILAAVVLICTKKYRKQGIILFAGLAVGVLVGSVILKPLIARPRPCWLDSSIKLLIPTPSDYSFPSGHTLISVIAAVILTTTNPKFGWFAIPLAALISFSRLYLYVHFPSDILGGLVIGVLIGVAVMKLGRKLFDYLEMTHESVPGDTALVKIHHIDRKERF